MIWKNLLDNLLEVLYMGIDSQDILLYKMCGPERS